MKITRKPSGQEKMQERVDHVYLHNAFTGPHIRSYILAKIGTWKSQVVQIVPKESRKYQTLTIKLHTEMLALVAKGISFLELRTWAAQRKEELLT